MYESRLFSSVMEGEEGKPSLLRFVEEREREGQRGVVAGEEGGEKGPE